ncbi:MAG: DNA double-strand break repair nuclease NurA, partial [Nanoarchaeota archaeon]|nr:DNA double-strand break repair nuclease NurA [Nanoarchaeota archaeon]
PVRMDKLHLHDIAEIKTDKKTLFIDGGNQEIIGAPHFSLQFIRIYYTIYQNNKRVKNNKIEFYALIRLRDSQSKERIAEAKIFGKDLFQTSLSFDLDELDIEANLSTVGNLLRRISELRTAAMACDGLSDSSIVLDGTLFSPTKIEQEYMAGLLKQADATSNAIAAVSKTSNLVTNDGIAITSAIHKLGSDGCWYYHPIAEIDDAKYPAELYLARLNEKSAYSFVVEQGRGTRGTKQGMTELFSILKANSTDPVFPGYPYGLVEADRFGRVSNKEKDRLRTVLMAKAGKSWKALLEAESQLKAHSVLDNIR